MSWCVGSVAGVLWCALKRYWARALRWSLWFWCRCAEHWFGGSYLELSLSLREITSIINRALSASIQREASWILVHQDTPSTFDPKIVTCITFYLFFPMPIPWIVFKKKIITVCSPERTRWKIGQSRGSPSACKEPCPYYL